MNSEAVITHTRRWIASMVIGLNLCPFAQRVFQGDKIRYVVATATDDRALLAQLTDEILALTAMPAATVETTLLIHPLALGDYLEYNDFLDPAEQLIEDLGLLGVVQIAGFHPHYQFADAEADAVENYTNRSPYPMLHLLREDSVTAVASDANELLAIPQRNIATLRALGREAILARLEALK